MGIRDKATGLWLVDLEDQGNRYNSALAVPTEQPPQYCSSNSALTVAEPVTLTSNSEIARETMLEQIQFLHAALGYPVLDTFRDAIEPGHYSSVPELTAARASKFLDPSVSTIKGHMDMAQKNVRLKNRRRNAIRCYFPQEQQKLPGICIRQSQVWNAATQFWLNFFPSLAKCIRICPAYSSVRW